MIGLLADRDQLERVATQGESDRRHCDWSLPAGSAFAAAAALWKGGKKLASLCIVILQFGPSWTMIAAVTGIFFVGQLIADHVLAPNLVGSRVKLYPVWIIFAVFASGYLFGFVGLLIAVPLAAAIGVLVRFALCTSGGARGGGRSSGSDTPTASDGPPAQKSE